jgi:DNA-binding response OmpR family regulator
MNNYRILVVDDEVSTLKLLTVNLEARGFRVHQAEDGEKAIGIFNGNQIDLVLLDIMMPKINGHDVCRIIKEKSTVPIIMLSGLDGPQDKASCLDSGADDYITKPFSLRVLFSRLEAVLRQVYFSAGNQQSMA